MFLSQRLRSNLVILVAVMAPAVCAPPAMALPRGELVLANSAEDAALTAHLTRLGRGVNPSEARHVAYIAYTTGQELARKWDVVSSPTFQNFLINIGAREAGYCYQWATELLIRLDRLKLRTLDLHWAESDAGTDTEHNVIVVTAHGQPFIQGIMLDNWRHMGHLLWGPITGDPSHTWQENQGALGRRLQRRTADQAQRKKNRKIETQPRLPASVPSARH